MDQDCHTPPEAFRRGVYLTGDCLVLGGQMLEHRSKRGAILKLDLPDPDHLAEGQKPPYPHAHRPLREPRGGLTAQTGA